MSARASANFSIWRPLLQIEASSTIAVSHSSYHACDSSVQLYQVPLRVLLFKYTMVSFIKNNDPSEELITDRFHDVIDPQFYFSTITEAQNSLMSIPVG